MARKYTNLILEMNDDGFFDKDQLIQDLLSWMSEADVKAFYERYIEETEQDYEDDMDGDHASALASVGWGTDEDYGG